MIKDKVEKIMKIMNHIEYGFQDEFGNNIMESNPKHWKEHFDSFYYLQTPEELLRTKCGICWDQVELERKLFTQEKVQVKTFFIYILDGNQLPSHTFLIYEEDNKYYWFEHAWNKYKGIHRYSSEESLLRDIINKFREEHKKKNQNLILYLYEYQKPKEHIKCNEFYKYIETQNRISLQ